jgi:hypothetical protein
MNTEPNAAVASAWPREEEKAAQQYAENAEPSKI